MINLLTEPAFAPDAETISTLDIITGTEGDDTLSGTLGADTIGGLGGDDFIHGGGGDDSLVGGDGTDQLFGGLGDDTLVGGAGIDILHAGHGADLLQGGDGTDVLYPGHGDATLDGGAGIDGALFTEVWGNALVVDLAAGTASTSKGVFHLISIESVIGNNHAATIIGSDAANTLVGGSHSDVIEGGSGADVLNSGGAKDTLIGGHGADVLIGGVGADRFVFGAVNDSLPSAPDNIQDLEKHDLIDLSAIDADVTTAGDQAFTRVSALSGHAGELALIFDAGSGSTLLQADIDGDGAADMTVILAGDHTDFKDFVL